MVIVPFHRAPVSALTVPGYRVLGRCWEDPLTITFAGEEVDTGASVLIKILKAQRSDATRGALLRDYQLASSIDGDFILKPLLHGRSQDLEYLVLPEDGSRPLRDLSLERRFTLIECLEILVRAAGTLDELHRRQIVHRNLNPSTIWFNRRKLETKVV